MSTILNAQSVFAVVAALLIGALALALRIAARRSARAASLERDAAEDYRARMEHAESRSNRIIHRALRQARRLFVSAELASIKEHARESVRHQKLHALSREEVGKLTERVTAEFSADVAVARKSYEQTLSGVRGELEKILETSRASLTDAVRAHEQFLEGFRRDLTALREGAKGVGDQILEKYAVRAEEELRDLGRSAAALIRERVDEEIREIRSALAGYTEARQRLVDEHIVELVERTAAIALTESLSLAEHSRLVYRALEEARREGFFESKKNNNKATTL
ncbi:MAG: hypothetical protein Q8R39_04930 [bacterium]|nr:hypothetical protein [bacterium]MDZ4284787.1 hypothetical protein [Patescibacteria group bacterium]